MRGNLLNKLRLAQLKDVAEMQLIYEAAVDSNVNEACEKIIGSGPFHLSDDVREGVERQARCGYWAQS